MTAELSHPSLAHTDHRPWPLGDDRWSWRQSWVDLLFAHWPVDVATLRPFVHPELTIQEFDGTSWIGLVPFRMEGVTRRGLPEVPGLSAFPEVNLRVYVEHDGKSGVWFFSLDASNALAVAGAKTFYRLPYHLATIKMDSTVRGFRYGLRRQSKPPLLFEAEYGPTSEVYMASPGTLEHWLTERYCLYGPAAGGGVYRIEVHHEQWPLQQASAEFGENHLGRPFGLAFDELPAHLHFARGVDVTIWSPQQLA